MLKGITHVHSRYSFDGQLELREVHNLLTKCGFDFALMSEHIEELTSDAMKRFLEECALLSTEGCTMVPGIEIDDMHILIYGISEVPSNWSTVTQLAEEFVRQGALIIISHPVKIHGVLPNWVESWAEGVEVWNTRYDGRRAPRLGSIELYQARKKSKNATIALGGVDFHSVSDLSDVRIDVSAPDASRDGLLSAIRAGDFTIMNGISKMELTCSQGSQLASGLRTTFFDLGVRVNRQLKAAGIVVPAWLRNAIRKRA